MHDRHAQPLRHCQHVETVVRGKRDTYLGFARPLRLDLPAGAGGELVGGDVQLIDDHPTTVPTLRINCKARRPVEAESSGLACISVDFGLACFDCMSASRQMAGFGRECFEDIGERVVEASHTLVFEGATETMSALLPTDSSPSGGQRVGQLLRETASGHGQIG